MPHNWTLVALHFDRDLFRNPPLPGMDVPSAFSELRSELANAYAELVNIGCAPAAQPGVQDYELGLRARKA